MARTSTRLLLFVTSLSFLHAGTLARTHRPASRSGLRGRRYRVASRNFSAQPRPIGRLGEVVQDNSPIYAEPGRRPLYFIAPRETYLILVGQKDDHYAVMMSDGRYGWIAKARISLLDYNVVSNQATGNPEVDHGNKIVSDAFKYLGLPYIWGGYSTSGTDCSGFVKAVFAQNGVGLPRVAREQAMIGREVQTSELAPGDRVYFSFKGQYIDHTGLYIGNGYFIHNSISNGRVAVNLLSSPKYLSHLVRCMR